jgi:SAM-dependent methyltransferase
MSEWPGKGRREAHPSEPTYALRAPLSAWLQEEARSAHAAYGDYRLLDVGCGVKPYHPFFAPYASEHVGVDIGNPAADLEGPIESLPSEESSFDVVLCTQVLEHCLDPAQAVRELYRVTKPGGRVLASTHGVYVFHPAPTDHWRWTHTGLERVFRENGDWASVTVTPAAGTTATLGMLIAIYVDLIFKNLRVRAAGKPLMSAINRIAAAVDARSQRLAGTGPGSLIANYHVVAVK